MGVWVLRYKLQRPRNEKGVMGFRTNWKEHEEKKMESLGQLEERERETLRQKVKSEKHIYIYRERERDVPGKWN